MKRRLEQQVFYRRLLVRMRKFGWKLKVTPEGAWVLRHPKGGLIIRPHQPRSKNACYRLAKEMRTQEKAMRKNGGQPWDGSARKSNGHSRTGLEPITAETRLKLWPTPPFVGSAARSMVTS
jgi:hypothetical protein